MKAEERVNSADFSAKNGTQVAKPDEAFKDRWRMAAFAKSHHSKIKQEQKKASEHILSLKRQLQSPETGYEKHRLLKRQIGDALERYRQLNFREKKASETAQVEMQHQRSLRSLGFAVFRSQQSSARSESPVRWQNSVNRSTHNGTDQPSRRDRGLSM